MCFIRNIENTYVYPPPENIYGFPTVSEQNKNLDNARDVHFGPRQKRFRRKMLS